MVGAGGLGSYVGSVLLGAGHEVWLVARGEHRRALEADGLLVRSDEGEVRLRPGVVGSADEVADPDVVVVAVKAYSLDEVTPQVARAAERGAAVLPLLNGVDTAARLRASGVQAERVVDGVAYLTAFRTAPGEIQRKGTHQRLVVGSADARAAGAVERVRALFEPTPVEVRVADDIAVELWEKMAVVCSLSVVCCLADAPIGAIRAHPLGPDVQARAIAEVLAVGRARGVALPRSSEETVGAVLDGFPAPFFPSVLHDLRSGRPTEMDALAGVLARMGRETGTPTPLLDAATVVVALRGEDPGPGPS